MKVSINSFFIAFLWTLIVTLGIRVLRKWCRLTKTYEQKFLFCLYVLCIVRLFIPIDFLFTQGFSWKGAYTKIFTVITEERIHIFSLNISLSDILLIVIAALACYNLISFFRNYFRELRFFRSCAPFDTDQLARIHARLRRSVQIPKADVLVCSFVRTPFTMGFRKKRIILPDITFSDDELFCILFHEYMHILRHDLLFLLSMHIFYCVFSWIPFAGSSKSDFVQTLEIGCDISVFRRLSRVQKISYLEIMLDSIRMAGDMNPDSGSFALGFAIREDTSLMKERFSLLADASHEDDSIWRLVLFALAFGLFISSYLAIPLPGVDPSVEEIEADGDFYLDPDAAYVYESDGIYYLYTADENTLTELSSDTYEHMLKNGFPRKEQINEQ